MTKNEEIIYETKYPITSYIGAILFLFALGGFSYQLIFAELPILDGIILFSITFLIIDFAFCGYAGKLILKKDELYVKYFFPWHTSKHFKFKSIAYIKTNWPNNYIFFSKAYIKDDMNNQHSFKIHSYYGLFNGIIEFEKIVKKTFKIQ